MSYTSSTSFFKSLLLLILFTFVPIGLAADPVAGLDEAANNLNNGRYAQAEQLYREVLEQKPVADVDFQARKGLAITCAAQKKDADVDAAVDRLIADYPGNTEATEAVCNVGDQYYSKQDFARARQLFHRTVNECPRNAFSMWAQCGIANSSIRQGQDTEAKAAIDKLVADYSGHENAAMAVCFIADNYRELQKSEKADDLYQIIAKNWPGHERAMWAKMHLAMKNIEGGNLPAAQAMVDDLFTNYSQHPYLIRAICYIAGRYYDRQAFEKADQLYQRIAAAHPEGMRDVWSQAAGLIATMRLTDTDIPQEAIDKVQADFASDPELPKVLSWFGEIYYKKGTALQNEGLSDQAKDRFEKAIAVWDKVKGSYYEYAAYYGTGLCYQALEDYSKAAQAFESAYQTNPEFEYADYCLFARGDCYERLMQSKTVSEAEAKPVITEAYSELASKYLHSPYASYAESWLQNN